MRKIVIFAVLLFARSVFGGEVHAAGNSTLSAEVLLLTGLIFMTLLAAISWIVCWKYSTRWKRLQTVVNELPLRFCVCGSDGTILLAHAEPETDELSQKAKTIQDLPADSRDLEQIFRNIRATGASENTPRTEVLKSGRKALFQKMKNPLFGTDAILWISFDISRQLELRKKLEESEKRYEEIMNNIAGAVIVTDRNGKVERINPETTRLTGYSAGYSTGLEVERIFRIEDHTTGKSRTDLLKDVLENGGKLDWRDDCSIRTGTGKSRPMEFCATAVRSMTGERNGMVIAFLDRTDIDDTRGQLELQKKLLELHTELTECAWMLKSGPDEELFSSNFHEIWPMRNGKPIPREEWVLETDYKRIDRQYSQLCSLEISGFHENFRSNYFGRIQKFHLRGVSWKNDREQKFAYTVIYKNENEPNENDNEHLFKELLESCPCALFVKEVSDHYRYVLCSRAMAELMEKKDEKQLLGLTDYELFDHETAGEIRNSDREASCKGNVLDVTEKIRKPSGVRYIRTLKGACNTSDGRRMLLGIAVDATAAETERNRLLELLNFYVKMVERLPVAVSVKDANADLKYLIWNKCLERQTGYTAAQVIGKNDFEIEPFKGKQQWLRDKDRNLLESGKNIFIRENFETALGKKIFYSTSKSIVHLEARRLIVELREDLSDILEMGNRNQEQLRKLNEYIMRANTVNTCLKRVTAENNFNKAVDDLLLIVGGAMRADRCYAYHNTPDNRYTSCTHEWVREGISPQKDNLQHVDLQELTGWQNRLEKDRCIELPDIDSLPEDLNGCKTTLKVQNIQSLLAVPFLTDDRVTGFIGVDYVREKYNVTGDDLRMLQDTVSIYQLIEQKKRFYNAVAESSSIQKMIIEIMPIPVIMIDRDFIIIHANKAAKKFAGRELAGKEHCFSFLCRRTAPDAQCTAMKAIRTEQPVVEEQMIAGRNIQVSAIPVVRNGELVYLLETFVDLTEITRSRDLLERAAKDAEKAAQAKSLFLATMSHELRTPLNAVIGFAEMLELGGMSPKEQSDAIKAIHLSGNTLLTLINDVLDLSKLEAGEMKINPEQTSFPAIAKELQVIFDGKIKEKNLKWSMHVSPVMPPLYLDPLRIRQILLNLIGNAVKFTDRGGIELSADFNRETPETGRLTVTVRDTGIGIEESALPRIFDPFVQASGGMHGRKGAAGTGLGLPICKKLTESMGGTLNVTSSVGKGSSFTVVLPSVRCETAAGDSPQPKEFCRISRVKGKLLLVDDVPVNLRVLEVMARHLGLSTRSVGSAKEAWNMLGEYRPDMVLTDLWMPDMNGIELAEAIHSVPEYRKIKIAAVTADAESKEEFPSGTFDAVLLKPVSIEKFRELMEKLPGEPSNE